VLHLGPGVMVMNIFFAARRWFALTFLFTFAVASAPAQSPTQFKHVVVVALENHSYSKVIGNPAMPFLNSLADQYGLARNFYAKTHPSIGNYFRITTGQTITNDDGFTGTVSVDNIVRELTNHGLTWKSYAESLPYAGYMNGDTGEYSKHHNPFVYLTDVLNNSTQRDRVVPFTDFASDLNAGTLPNFSFIVPNLEHDAHNCPDGSSTCTDTAKLIAADQWMQTYIAPVLSNPQFEKDGLLVLWWDEGNETDTNHGGGHIAVVLAGSGVKPAYQSNVFYMHDSLLRTFADIFQFTAPGNAAAAPSMSEFFRAAPTSNGTLTGHVYNASSGASKSGATISVAGSTATTDSAGNFSIADVAPGSYSLAVSASGYLPRTVTVAVTSGATTSVSLPIATAGKIKGLVTTASGTTISGAQIVVSGGAINNSLTVNSTSTGYQTPYIAVGNYTVTVNASGYSSKTQTATVNTGTTTTLNITLQ